MRRRLRKVIGWATLLLAAVAVGGGWFAYSYVTDSETLRQAIRDGAPRFLPGCLVEVNRVQVRPLAGKLVLGGVSLRKREGAAANPYFVGETPWIEVLYDPWAMLDGRFELREIVVAQPKVRLRRHLDGAWNLTDLLADPWPLPPSETSPPIRIKNGTLELVDEADGPDALPAAILRDVSVTISSGDLRGTPIQFAAQATGDLCEAVNLQGTIDRATGRVALSGDLRRLAISSTLAGRLPAPARAAFRSLGLSAGTADLALRSLALDTKGGAPPRYDATLELRDADWKCEKLPFAINDLSATVAFRDGVATIERGSGRYGTTAVRASGTFGLDDLQNAPFRLGLEAVGLELKEPLRGWSIQTFKEAARAFWEDFRPSGVIDVEVVCSRALRGGPVDWGVAATCRDVGMEYREFRYPLDHIAGELTARPDRVTVDLHALVNGKPLSARGTIDRPGPACVVDLALSAGSLPIDRALLDAMPRDIRGVLLSFQPAGTVRGTANIHRTPPVRPGDDPKGTIAIHADLDLNPGCSMTWDGLKYTVRDLTGHLELHPDSWIFRGMRGTHGQAAITGEGRVDKRPDGLRVGLHVHAEDLLFESQLRAALEPKWQKAWDTLNPTGSSDVDVKIDVEPGKPGRNHLEIDPRPQTNLRLRFERVAVEGDGGGPRVIEMPMEDVRGHFVFDDGVVTMTGGRFTFRNSPVEFLGGEVQVFDSGRFSLKVKELAVDDFKLDYGLRKLMPPVMAQYALRLDDGKPFRIRTDLALGWSGKDGELATCAWENGTVVFVDNTIQAGVPLRHLQGQLDHLRGSFDGRNLVVSGALDLASVNLFDAHVTAVSTPIEVGAGEAKLTDIRGTIMGGTITGALSVGLESTPKFVTHLSVDGIDLREYDRAVPGRQEYRGLVSGRVDLSGMGHDLHTLQGSGEAHVTDGDLGKLPGWARLIKGVNFAPMTRTAFDEADVWFTIRNGMTTFTPIALYGDAFSLHGRGTLDPQGDLDVKLGVLYSRDKLHIPGVSDVSRELGGQILVIRVSGPVVAPSSKLDPFPAAGEFAKFLAERRAGTRPPRGRQAMRFPLTPRRGDASRP